MGTDRRTKDLPVALLAIGLLALAGCADRPGTAPVEKVRSAPQPAERPLSNSPYRNTVPGVMYVGDAQCAACHEEIAQAFARHPMGQSMREVAEGEDEWPGMPLDGGPASFVADGLKYSVAWDGARMVHREQRFDGAGKLVVEKSEAVEYSVGAGSHGRSFLIEREGTLWMSPITWYPQRMRWALSPNFELQNHHFNRPILPDCLFCHSNRAHPVADTVNRYQSPPFTGLTIGCERCHGPGELHVAHREAGEQPDRDGIDQTIVNPARLEPNLRDGVCQQCHLSGTIRVVPAGRDPYDYRPGLPWHELMSVFLKTPAPGERLPITSHEAQMRSSRCYTGSAGRLSCLSCHDPHRKPEPAEAAGWYRDRCAACHNEAACRETPARRQATVPADNCIACHMPAVASEVQHAAITDHRVPRLPDLPVTPQPARGKDALPLDFFHADRIDKASPEAQRDLAIAVMELAAESPVRVRPAHLERVAATLEEVVQRTPDDLPAAEALAHAHFLRNRPPDAARVIDQALARAPRRETLLAAAALVAAETKNWPAASRHAATLVEINPWQVRYRQMLAQAAIAQREYETARQACEVGLEVDPVNQPLRQALVSVLDAMGDSAAAERQRQLLRRLASDRRGRKPGG